MPNTKPKKLTLPARSSKNLLTLLFIALLGVAALFVSQRLSSQKSVSPNSPDSQPMAAACGDVGTSGKCDVAGGCNIGQKCTRVGGPDSFECQPSSSCPVCGSAGTSGQCGSLGKCGIGKRCTRVGGPDDFSCLTDTTCSGGGGSSSSSGGGSNSGDCSSASASSCQGKSDGSSCNGGTCNTTNKKGNDGKYKCACDTGTKVRPTCLTGYVSTGACEAGLRPVTLTNCCVKK